MTTPEIIAAGKDVILGLAAAFTAVAAVFGLKSWSRELKGKAEFEVARNLIRATYKLRAAIQDCRRPLILVYEYPEGNQGSTPEEKTRAHEHVYKNRWAPVSSAVQEFDTCTLEAEALWGSEIRTRTDELRQCVKELRVAMGAVIDNEANRGEDFRSDKEFGTKMRRIVSDISGSKEKNKFSEKITAAINNIEGQIRPHLRRG